MGVWFREPMIVGKSGTVFWGIDDDHISLIRFSRQSRQWWQLTLESDPKPLALSSGLGGSVVISTGTGVRNHHNWTDLTRLSTLTAIWGQKRWDWLENSNSSVSLAEQKPAQLIGNRQKLQTGATSQNFSRQIPQYFSARKVHNRTVPLCYRAHIKKDDPSPEEPESSLFSVSKLSSSIS